MVVRQVDLGCRYQEFKSQWVWREFSNHYISVPVPGSLVSVGLNSDKVFNFKIHVVYNAKIVTYTWNFYFNSEILDIFS